MPNIINHSKISVIVPVYKVESYLCQCVDSILAQTYHNLEIILVDDGSPDHCGVICDEYAAKDPRIKVIHKENGGLSDARNAGMAVMTGEYVAFVDSDDWIEPQMYETLLMLLEQHDADIAFGGVADDVEHNGTVTTVKVSNYNETPFAEDKLSAMRRYFHGSWAAWDKLYRTALFDGIRYPVGEINEDEAIVLQLLDRCRRVCYTNEVFYHYMHRKGVQTITSSTFSKKKLAWVKHCADNLEFVREKHPAIVPMATARYRGSILWALREIALSAEDFRDERDTLLKTLRRNATIFDKAPFSAKSDRLRYLMLKYLPFGVFKAALHLRHNI